jgi:hypothetical protein
MRIAWFSLPLLVLLQAARADAQPATPATPQTADDGYCDYIEGTAAAEASSLLGPQLFGQFGYIEQPTFSETPSADSSNLRVIGGVRYSITNAIEGSARKRRANADCRRHRAVSNAQGATQARALQARLEVYDEAQVEADRILAQINADLEARRTTAPEALATKLRIDDLRAQAATTRGELARLPPATDQDLSSIFAAYSSADADMERSEARIRTTNNYDLSIRAGVDSFLQGSGQGANFFGVVQLGINLGALWVGGANDRAASGRRRYVKATQQQQQAKDVPLEQMRATLDVETKRLEQVKALVTDLQQQMDALARIDSDDSKRFRQTVWFDWVKAKAELAYLDAHVVTLRAIVTATAR